LKAAETGATKRALATFGRPFGLELYRGTKATKQAQATGEDKRAMPLPSAVQAKAAAAAQPSLPATKPAQAAHELGRAAGAAEKPRGLASASLESSDSAVQESSAPLPVEPAPELAPVAKYARDDTTPIPRPSTYYGRDTPSDRTRHLPRSNGGSFPCREVDEQFVEERHNPETGQVPGKRAIDNPRQGKRRRPDRGAMTSG
jgi:hypothetical protein